MVARDLEVNLEAGERERKRESGGVGEATVNRGGAPGEFGFLFFFLIFFKSNFVFLSYFVIILGG